MQIVIEMPEEKYKWLKENNPKVDKNSIVGAIVHGTPLPKGHGRLIDSDRLKEEMEKDVRRAMSFVDLTDFVWLAPTIIEKDKEQE